MTGVAPSGWALPLPAGPGLRHRPPLLAPAGRPEAIMTLRILAVETEELSLARLKLLIGHISGAQLVGTARTKSEALQLAARLKPDVILIEAQSREVDGFDVVESLAGEAPQIIFTSAFAEHATRAFDLNATDYLLKPLDLRRLAAALDKARAAVEAAAAAFEVAELHAVIAALRHQRPAPGKRRQAELWAQARGKFVRVPVADIDWIEAERDYVHLHVGPDSYMLRETLSGMHDRLGTDRFVRIRRSALVQTAKLVGIRRAGDGDFRVVLGDNCELRVGRTYLKQIRQMLRSLDG